MSTLVAVRQANAASVAKTLSKSQPGTVPTALFVGGTSGIGQATAEAFARHTQGNAHIILCERNRVAAERIIATFPKPTSTEAKHEFVECDATLLANVRDTAAGLVARLPRLNFLIITSGIMTLSGRDETPEGIDRKLALHYYSRWRFTHDLIPLLQKAKDSGEDAKVLTVLSAGSGGPINIDDLGLKHTFTLANAGQAASGYNDLIVQSFAARYPSIAFTHAAPGGVRTALFRSSPSLALRLVNPLLMTLVTPFTHSQADSGEFMLRALLAGESGAYWRGGTAQEVKPTASNEKEREALWSHTAQVTGGGRSTDIS